MPAEAEQVLVDRSRQGDVAAFEELVLRHQGVVCALTCSAMGDRALGEDLAQETFVSAWRSLSELRAVRSFRAWLCTIARNLCRNARRDRGREIAVEALDPIDGAIDVADALAGAEVEDMVWRALSQLHATYREPLVLYYRQGCSTAEVAETLGLTVDAVEQRLSRGRRALKAGVEALVDDTLERSRPSGKVRAGVIGVIGSPAAARDGGPVASAAPRTAIAVSTVVKIAAALGLCGVAGVVIASTVATRSDAPRERMDASRTTDGAAATAPEASSPAELAAMRLRAAHERANAEAPIHYELTEVDETRWAVALAGGPSSATSTRDYFSEHVDEAFAVARAGDKLPIAVAVAKILDEPVPPIVRRLVGRVLDENGDPVAGAIVLLGGSLMASGSLGAEAGATTGADGRFSLELRRNGAGVAIALHDTAGWSAPTPVAQDATEVVLRLAPVARLEGTVARAGELQRADVHIASQDGAFWLSAKSGIDGTWTVRALPPGTYSIRAVVARDIGGGAGFGARETVVLAAGERRSLDLVIPVGALVAVDVRPPEGSDHHTLEYTFLPGRHAPADYDALQDLEAWREGIVVLLGGDDRHDVMQFHDIAEGPATFCVELARDRATVAFGCETVEVPGAGELLEIELAPDPLP